MKKKPSWLRLACLALLLAGFYLASWGTGISEHLTIEKLKNTVQSAGMAGIAFFMILYAAGNLFHVPGLLFVSASILVYGHLLGGLVALVGSLFAISFSFWVVRSVGGNALDSISHPFLKKILLHLEEKPVYTIALLRSVMISSPPLNYVLALSEIRYRDYLVGSALGLCPPILFVALTFYWVVR